MVFVFERFYVFFIGRNLDEKHKEWSRKLSTNASFGIAEAIKLQFQNHLNSKDKKLDV